MPVRQNPWTPTKRRGPIAAEHASPGPAIVALPGLVGTKPQESKKSRAPAFSFGLKHSMKTSAEIGPGPASYNTEGYTAKGRCTAPASSLHSRYKHHDVTATPAPCDYNADKAQKYILDKAPKYTFGLKTKKNNNISHSPAPNMYRLPAVLGEAREGNKPSAPAYTMIGRGLREGRESPAPGPGQYEDSGDAAVRVRRRPPAFSMAPRRDPPPPTLTVPGPGNYAPEKADGVLHENSPKYSFGTKSSLSNDTITPGPNVYAPEKSIKMLDQSPKYSFGTKANLEKPADTPAPNLYCPEKADKALHESSPAYSFRNKSHIDKINETPGPNCYAPERTLHMLNGTPKYSISGKGTVEKPFDTPAPNAYDSGRADKALHDNSPSYSFGIKDHLHKRNDVPGPNVYAPEKSFHMLDATPGISFGVKPHPQKSIDTPGPNVYNVDRSDKILHESAPAFSFRVKDQLGNRSDTPGPNVYNPHLLSDTPQYSFGIKASNEKQIDTPGPNMYSPEKALNILYDSSPAFTFKNRNNLMKPNNNPGPNAYDPNLTSNTPMYTFGIKGAPEKPADVPGPNAYFPEKADNVLHESSPSYTFRTKDQTDKPSYTPGPNVYAPEISLNMLNGTPKYTFGIKGPDGKFVDTPAPNAYTVNNVLLDSAPAYSFGIKDQVSIPSNTPGPNMYSPENAIHMLNGTPKYSFGTKTLMDKPMDTPAPNAYLPENVLDGAPKYSFGLKGLPQKLIETPGPNAYHPEKSDKVLLENAPHYSFRIKPDYSKLPITPAPNAYNPDKSDKVILSNSPQYTFRIKTPDGRIIETPAPNMYSPENSLNVISTESPKYTFGIKSQAGKLFETPAPNVYKIPEITNTPLYTISGRHKVPIDERIKVPGPGEYSPEKSFNFVLTYSPNYTFGVKLHTKKYLETPAPNAYCIPSVLDTPLYTISGRHKVPVDERVKVPAPGTYSPEKVVLNAPPAHTFGIRHSPYIGQLKALPAPAIDNVKDMSSKVQETNFTRERSNTLTKTVNDNADQIINNTVITIDETMKIPTELKNCITINGVDNTSKLNDEYAVDSFNKNRKFSRDVISSEINDVPLKINGHGNELVSRTVQANATQSQNAISIDGSTSFKVINNTTRDQSGTTQSVRNISSDTVNVDQTTTNEKKGVKAQNFVSSYTTEIPNGTVTHTTHTQKVATSLAKNLLSTHATRTRNVETLHSKHAQDAISL